MSHWSTVETEFTNEDCLIDALKEMFPEHKVVKNASVSGYQNSQKADVVLEAKGEGYRTYDIGFRKNKDGRFTQVADWWGLDWLGNQNKFQDKLKQSYAKATVKKQAKKFGWSIKQKQQEDGTVKLLLTKF